MHGRIRKERTGEPNWWTWWMVVATISRQHNAYEASIRCVFNRKWSHGSSSDSDIKSANRIACCGHGWSELAACSARPDTACGTDSALMETIVLPNHRNAAPSVDRKFVDCTLGKTARPGQVTCRRHGRFGCPANWLYEFALALRCAILGSAKVVSISWVSHHSQGGNSILVGWRHCLEE